MEHKVFWKHINISSASPTFSQKHPYIKKKVTGNTALLCCSHPQVWDNARGQSTFPFLSEVLDFSPQIHTDFALCYLICPHWNCQCFEFSPCSAINAGKIDARLILWPWFPVGNSWVLSEGSCPSLSVGLEIVPWEVLFPSSGHWELFSMTNGGQGAK